MKIVIELTEFTQPVGTHLTPMLDIGYKTEDSTTTIWFNNEEEITELSDRYKYDIMNDWEGE